MINKKIRANGRVALVAGTICGTLSKMEKDGLINIVSEHDRRKIHLIDDFGLRILKIEIERL